MGKKENMSKVLNIETNGIYNSRQEKKQMKNLLFYFWYRACIAFKSCRGEEYMMNTFMTMLVMLLCLCLFVKLVSL